MALSLLVLLAWMLFGKIDPARIRNVIIVVSTTIRVSRIVQFMGKLVISVVKRTTLKLCVDPWMRDENMNLENASLIRPRNAHIDIT